MIEKNVESQLYEIWGNLKKKLFEIVYTIMLDINYAIVFAFVHFKCSIYYITLLFYKFVQFFIKQF